MQERKHAAEMVAHLSRAEKDALAGLIGGEALSELAQRRSVSVEVADDIREGMRWKLGVVRDAEAVRIGLLAGLLALEGSSRGAPGTSP